MFNFYKNFILVCLVSFSFASYYNVGDQIQESHQEQMFNICYGAEAKGYFDNCEAFDTEDECLATSQDETYEDTNGDGEWTDEERYTDTNGNGMYDDGEPFMDDNDNGVWDEAEPLDDWNGDGEWTPGDFMYDCEWQNGSCREEPVFGLGHLNGYSNDSGVFYVYMLDMAASW